MVGAKEQLALRGGPPAVQTEAGDVFAWPIITREDEEAVLEVLRQGGMSGMDVTLRFEEEFAAEPGMRWLATTAPQPCTAPCMAAGWAWVTRSSPPA